MKNLFFLTLKFNLYVVLLLGLLSCKKDDPEPGPIEVPLIERMLISVVVTEDNLTVKLPLTGTVDCEIDWYDGNKESVSKPYPTHTYTKAGRYVIMISGTVTALNSSNLNESELSRITGVYNWGKTGLTSINSAFKGCTELEYIAADSEGSLANVIDAMEAFSDCESLKEILAGLFDHCTLVTSFRNTFSNCSSLTEIPAGLFDHCTLVTSFSNTFSGCSDLIEIPAGLFDYSTNADDFTSSFQNCVSLKKIPIGLFDHCTIADNFFTTFENCTSLAEIPIGLFDHCTQIYNLIGTFAGCKNLEGESPYTIVEGNKIHLYERENGNGFRKPSYNLLCFKGCSGLSDYKEIPSDWK